MTYLSSSDVTTDLLTVSVVHAAVVRVCNVTEHFAGFDLHGFHRTGPNCVRILMNLFVKQESPPA